MKRINGINGIIMNVTFIPFITKYPIYPNKKNMFTTQAFFEIITLKTKNKNDRRKADIQQTP
jgi:hypothetical protein